MNGFEQHAILKDKISERLADALDYTIELFGRDARKQSEVPVLAHLLSVCALVQLDGGDEDEAIAGLLHDVLEDKPSPTRAQEISSRFGARVLELIQIASDTRADYVGGNKPPWRERRERYLRHVRATAPGNLRVTVADKVDNVRALIADHQRIGELLWRRFNAGRAEQLWYYRSAAEAYREAGVKGPLIDELSRLVAELEETAALAQPVSTKKAQATHPVENPTVRPTRFAWVGGDLEFEAQPAKPIEKPKKKLKVKQKSR